MYPSNRSPIPSPMPTSTSNRFQTQDSIVGPSDQYGMQHQFNHRNINAPRNGRNPHINSESANDIIGLKQQGPQINSMGTPTDEETKVCVIVDSRTPVIFKIPIPSSRITLSDLKSSLPAINQPGYKYFFKSSDSEFGIVKEEIQDDFSILPTYRNRIVAWIVTPGHMGDELASKTKSETNTYDQTYSNATPYDDRSSTLMTTDVDTTSYFTETEEESYSCSNYSETSSSGSQSDATAVRCLTVHLVLTNENFLGLHIYANSVNGIDEGIYVAEVTPNSAVALDGRIEPGDKLIQVNDTSLEELSNDESIRILEQAVIKRGPLKLVVAKFEDSSRPKDVIHPIDTAAWVAHAQALTMPNTQLEHANSATSSPSFGSNAQDTDCITAVGTGLNHYGSGLKLNKNSTDLGEIIQHMKLPKFGLDIKDREWLKIKIPKAFLGSQLVNWLERNVQGFSNSRDAKKFASRLLKEGYIRDPISGKSFSSKSYYTFVV